MFGSIKHTLVSLYSLNYCHMELLSKHAKSFLCIPLLGFGAMHLLQASGVVSTVDVVMSENPRGWMLFTGLSFFLTALSIGFKKYDRQSSLGLALVLALVVAAVYAPHLGSSNESIQTSSVFHMTKDIVLAGGSLAYASLASVKLY